jgi:hypothetical protein
LVPSSDGGDDFVRIGDPREGHGLLIVFIKEAVDRRLKIGDRSEHAAL